MYKKRDSESNAILLLFTGRDAKVSVGATLKSNKVSHRSIDPIIVASTFNGLSCICVVDLVTALATDIRLFFCVCSCARRIVGVVSKRGLVIKFFSFPLSSVEHIANIDARTCLSKRWKNN